MSNGLVATIYPDFFNRIPGFGTFTNCFTFLTGFDDNFIGSLGVTALRQEILGWTELTTIDQWKKAVVEYFSPAAPKSQPGSVASREGKSLSDILHENSQILGLDFDYPWNEAICFPKVEGALDYHWAIYNGHYWLEQAGHAGPLNIWATKESMLQNVYNRKSPDGKYLYVKGSAFRFRKKVE